MSIITRILRKIKKEVFGNKSSNNVNSLPESEEIKFASKHRWLQKYNINKILDIGANEGQLAKKYRALFPEAMIISFEPLKDVYEKLLINFENDKHFKAYNYALGDKEGKELIYINEYSPSSSILKLGDKHKDNFSFAVKETPAEIDIKMLDSLDLINDSDKTLVKIDVQGYENFVIKGGKKTLSKCKIIIVELSYKSLYINEPAFHEVYSMIVDLGFSFAGVLDQLYSPLDGEILQGDAIFIKKENV